MSDTVWSLLVAGAVAAAGCAAVLQLMLGTRLASRVLDRPNDRSMHVRPTPRIGGLGILAGLALAIAVSHAALRPAIPTGLWIGLALLVAVSLLDDLHNLKASTRLPLHLLAAGIAAAAVLPGAGWVAIAAATLAIGWMLNLYNFMDGSDGLAGGQALFGFGAFALAATAGGDPAIAIASGAVAGAAAGFLLFNFPPARVFMGDAGSTALGFLAAALGALGAVRGVWSPLFPLLAFLPFVFDASTTLALRLARGSRVWEAHREHAYQRLNLGGLGHRRTALAYWALMAFCAGSALAVRDAGGAVLAVLLGVHGCLYYGVQRSWSRRQPTRTPS